MKNITLKSQKLSYGKDINFTIQPVEQKISSSHFLCNFAS
jgi:hypothetical protein